MGPLSMSQAALPDIPKFALYFLQPVMIFIALSNQSDPVDPSCTDQGSSRSNPGKSDDNAFGSSRGIFSSRSSSFLLSSHFFRQFARRFFPDIRLLAERSSLRPVPFEWPYLLLK